MLHLLLDSTVVFHDKKKPKNFVGLEKMPTFAPQSEKRCLYMVAVVQLVRASDCGSECRGFESHLPPARKEEFQR